MDNKLSPLQEKLIPMLSWFHQYCSDKKLTYYLLGGTMLGAARHNGFIPWDDDIDVGMPRKDYEIFLKETKGKCFGSYIVEGIDTDKKDFYYGYSKIYDVNTTLIENTRYRIKRGIYIDVFPLDGVANSESEIPSVFNPIFRKYQFLLARTCAIRDNRKWYKNLAIRCARIVPFIDNKKLMKKIDGMCKTHDYFECNYVGNYYGNWGIREVVKREVMGTPVLYKFESLMVFGASDFDSYLTSLYGEWRKLPPKEKQVTHHDYLYCNLEKSYMEN